MARRINVKLIIQLKESGMSQREIASTRHISRNSVSDVFTYCNQHHVTYADVADMDENEVYYLVYPAKKDTELVFADPDYEYIHKELKKPGVTLKLLHDEYVKKCNETNQTPMGRTKFNEGYADFVGANNLTNHIEHKPGDRAEVDWAGKTMHYVNISTGEIVTVYLFVSVLPFSQYAYIEPRLDEKMSSFILCNVHMLEYFQGVPRRIVCDNLKTGVVSHPKEGEIILTDDYSSFGQYYVTAIMPAPVKRPKKKASVESTVGDATTAIIAALRNEKFYSFEAIKAAVARKLEEFNHAPFEKREGSRYEVWLEEKEQLRPLPATRYELAEWSRGHKVGPDCHIMYNKNHYSVPYQYANKKGLRVDLRITDTTVEIYYDNERIATHPKFPSYVKNKYSTDKRHMPPKFANAQEWDDERIRNWAKKIGPYTAMVIDRVFERVDIKEQGYNPCLSILGLAKRYSDCRLETACEIAIKRGIPSPRYRNLNSILSANQDEDYLQKKAAQAPAEDTSRGYLRGSDYYKGKGENN
jgi:transposase